MKNSKTDARSKTWKTTKGATLTEEDAQKLADKFEAEEIVPAKADLLFPRRAGRPSLTGMSADSPQVSFRVSPEIREQAQKAASKQGKTVSALAREALESYLRNAG